MCRNDDRKQKQIQYETHLAAWCIVLVRRVNSKRTRTKMILIDLFTFTNDVGSVNSNKYCKEFDYLI